MLTLRVANMAVSLRPAWPSRLRCRASANR